MTIKGSFGEMKHDSASDFLGDLLALCAKYNVILEASPDDGLVVAQATDGFPEHWITNVRFGINDAGRVFDARGDGPEDEKLLAVVMGPKGQQR